MKEAEAAALILQKENEGLTLSDADKLEICKDVELWKASRIPDYQVGNPYVNLFNFTEGLWEVNLAQSVV